MYDVIVIGAGLAGTLTALELSKKYKVLLIEAGSEVIPNNSSSYNECYKLHTGLHYVGDLKTAEQCLLNAIAFARKFPDYIAGGTNLDSPWRRGRHYIMNNSQVPVEKAKDIALYLKNFYAKLIEIDEKNKVFGEVENFIKFLNKTDYPYLAGTIPYYDANGKQSETHIALGIETAESQIDIYSLKAHLQQEITENPNITFLPSTKVTHIAQCPEQFGFTITTSDSNPQIPNLLQAKTVVNCAWQNIETLDRTVGAYVPDENRVNRIKMSILVELPQELRNLNTCIFSSGPYCSITVLPNGDAILTSERITNVGFYQAGRDLLPDGIQTLLNEQLKLNHPDGKKWSAQILEDCASYFDSEEKALFRQAEIKAIHVGFVKMMDMPVKYSLDEIYKTDSPIQSRQSHGIEKKGLGYIAHSGMKMTYTAHNASCISDIIDKDFITINLIEKIIPCVYGYLPKEVIDQNQQMLSPLINLTYRNRIIELISNFADENDIYKIAQLIANDILKQINNRASSLALIKTGIFNLKKPPEVENKLATEMTHS